MKKYLTGIFAFILMFTFIGNVSATSDTFAFSNIELVDSNDAEAKIFKNGGEINAKERFYKIGGYVKYRIKMGNNSGKSVYINKISDNLNNEYISSEYNYEKTEIKNNETYYFDVVLKLKKEITEESKSFTLPMNIVVDFSDEKNGSNTSNINIDINPDTKDNVLVYFIIFVLSAISLALFRAKKKKLLVLVITLGLIPSIAYATSNRITQTIDNDIVIINKKILNGENLNYVDKIDYGILENYYGDKMLVFKKNNLYTLINNSTNIKSTKEITTYTDNCTGKNYYAIDGELFDENNKSIYKNSNDFYGLENNFLIYDLSPDSQAENYSIYDILNKRTYNNSTYDVYKDIYANGKKYDYLYVVKNDKKYYIYIDGEIKEYKNKNFAEEKIKYYNNDNDILLLSYSLNDSNIEKLTNKFYIEKSNECNQVKKYEDNSLVIDKCFNEYDFGVNDTGNFAFIKIYDDKNITLILLPNGEYLLKEDIYFEKIGGDKLLYNDKDEFSSVKVVNSDGSVSESKCVGEMSLYKDKYICKDAADTYILNQNFERISDYYDNISCSYNDYCTIEKNGLKGLMYNNQIIAEPIYPDIMIHKDKIIVEDVFGYNLYYFDENHQIDKSKIKEYKFDKNVDVDKVISDYNLEDIRDMIYNNLNDFKLYAYIVLNNDGLEDENNRKFLLDYFKVYVDKIKYVNKKYFFNSLMKLHVVVGNTSVGYAAAEYNNGNIQITANYSYSSDEDVMKHEIMHFIDDRLNNNSYNSLYMYNGQVIMKEEYRNLNYKEKEKINYFSYISNEFLVEGGAEYYKGYYFFNGMTHTYSDVVKVVRCLKTLYGEEVDDVFFGNKNLAELLLRDISKEEFDEFVSLANEFKHDKSSSSNITDYMKLRNIMTKIYNNHFGNDWTNNSEIIMWL